MTDASLIKLMGGIVARNEAALGALYDSTSGRVFGLALRVVRDRSAAEEITLDVFTQIWRQPGLFNAARGSVLSWILAKTRSRAIDLLRHRVRREGREFRYDDAPSVRDEQPTPEKATELSERALRIRCAFEALPPEQREALEEAFFGGYSHSEVSARLKQPLGTVKTRIRSGLTSLRKTLTEQRKGIA